MNDLIRPHSIGRDRGNQILETVYAKWEKVTKRKSVEID